MMQDDIDTVVVPAGEDTFQTIWLKENRWRSIKMDPNMRPRCQVYCCLSKSTTLCNYVCCESPFY